MYNVVPLLQMKEKKYSHLKLVVFSYRFRKNHHLQQQQQEEQQH